MARRAINVADDKLDARSADKANKSNSKKGTYKSLYNGD